jgi:hypothetical protein
MSPCLPWIGHVRCRPCELSRPIQAGRQTGERSSPDHGDLAARCGRCSSMPSTSSKNSSTSWVQDHAGASVGQAEPAARGGAGQWSPPGFSAPIRSGPTASCQGGDAFAPLPLPHPEESIGDRPRTERPFIPNGPWLLAACPSARPATARSRCPRRSRRLLADRRRGCARLPGRRPGLPLSVGEPLLTPSPFGNRWRKSPRARPGTSRLAVGVSRVRSDKNHKSGGWSGCHLILAMRAHLPGLDHGLMDPAPALYTIRINGHLGATMLSAFPAMKPKLRGAETVLTGLLDRSALYGVLTEIDALGLDLLEVRLHARRPSPGDRGMVRPQRCLHRRRTAGRRLPDLSRVLATTMSSVPAQHAGIASAVNNDLARFGGLLAVAVLPPLAGITGTAYLHPNAHVAGVTVGGRGATGPFGIKIFQQNGRWLLRLAEMATARREGTDHRGDDVG